MALLRFLFLLVISTSTCFGHSMPGRKEDGHYDKDGKHNDEYDHESFLGHNGQEEFGDLDNQERVFRLAKLVDKIDKNDDNNVSRSELTAWVKYISLKEPSEIAKKHWADNYITVIDADGLLSWENYIKLSFPGTNYDEKVLARIKKYRKRFEAADENKDDKLSLDEYVAYQYMDLFPRMRDVFVDEVLEPLDLDKDGAVSLEEFRKGDKKPRALTEREFEVRDLNKNKVLEKVS
ncbi:calumenin-like isoform X3 [Paramuricea clavata]|uniref:Reticulocalbin-3 n=1 Tax=Paramuricea clavata TaxID=317549 RepID=A0A7D9KYK7_PARCT|nr:calumenin-like isoform X3 [Paramuricea clavata]